MKTRDGRGGLARTSRDSPQEPHLWPLPVHWQRPVLLYESDMARNEIMRLRTANANRAPGPSRSRTADAARVAIPLLIAFAAPSSLVVERDRPSQFPILGNGLPGTFVLFPGRLRVSLPTDQVVSADDTGGCAKVGFGGMRFTGMASGRTSSRQIAATRCGWSPSGSPRSSHTVNSCGPDLPAVFRAS